MRHRCPFSPAAPPAAGRKAPRDACLRVACCPARQQPTQLYVHVHVRATAGPCIHIIIPEGRSFLQAAAAGRRPRLSVAPRAAPPPHERHTDPHDLLNVDGAPLMSDPGDLGR